MYYFASILTILDDYICTMFYGNNEMLIILMYLDMKFLFNFYKIANIFINFLFVR